MLVIKFFDAKGLLPPLKVKLQPTKRGQRSGESHSGPHIFEKPLNLVDITSRLATFSSPQSCSTKNLHWNRCQWNPTDHSLIRTPNHLLMKAENAWVWETLSSRKKKQAKDNLRIICSLPILAEIFAPENHKALAKYHMRRELFISGLLEFNDHLTITGHRKLILWVSPRTWTWQPEKNWSWWSNG